MSAGKYDFSDAINAFFVESREMLEDMENALLELEKDIANKEHIPAIFRAAHTIKGSAGMFGFHDIGDFTHVVEDILDSLRNNVIFLEPEMLTLLLECHDHIIKLLDYFDANREAKIDPELKKESANLIIQLNSYLSVTGAKGKPEKIPTLEDEALSEMQVLNESWHISLRFDQNVFKNGLDPQSFITYLGQMGKIVNIKTIMDAIPKIDKMDPEVCYLGFEINFMGYTSKEKIEEVFEFVRDDCSIRILPPKSNLGLFVKLIDELPEEPMYIGEILTEIGSLTKKELNEALKLQSELKGRKKNKIIGEVIADEKMLDQSVIEAAANKQTNVRKAEDKLKKSMRIDTTKLDNLINLVGELVISASNVGQMASNAGDTKLIKTFSQMSRLIDNVRESSMNIRMVQIGESFRRFERVIRDISREKGKKVDLKLIGEETELDKTIIEKINDPLMHLVRNAVDHGIDLPEERIRKGKSATGRITLKAYNESGNIVIEISDDGGGLNRKKILKKALEMGLIKDTDVSVISDKELFQFIFLSGFSTADKVTEISGRGVGMDVVKKNIESLRGSVVLQSKEGLGTTVRSYLPLTLAIIDGFHVRAGSLNCVFPLAMVDECATLSKSRDEFKVNENGDFINYKGEILPYIRIRDLFKETGELPEREKIVIFHYNRKRVGFLVDETFGELQTVVKPLGKIFNKLQWMAGATILGGGEVGLILDVPKLIQYLQVYNVKMAS